MYLLQHTVANSAKRFPDKCAVVFGGEQITYRELDIVTDKLAAALVENGVRKGDRAGFYLNKSIQSVISILGILKAGGVYVPFDPNAPVARLSYIIKNAGMECLLISTKKLQKVREICQEDTPLRSVIVTDDALHVQELPLVKLVPWGEVLKGPALSKTEEATIDADLAYILYTSGSTGVPKGVMISHRTSLTFVNWSHDEFQITPDDRVSSHAPFHFDLSIFDLFTTFKAGATVFLAPEEYSIFPKRLIKFIRDSRITVWYSVPSILMHMMVHGGMKDYLFPDLRQILFAGEVFPVKYLRQLMEIIPHAAFYNLYGPTETNVCTFYHVKHVDPKGSKPVPIGKACRNTEVFALDERNGMITAPGKEGELFVRGSCVASGYWGDAEKTGKSFISNFLADRGDDKMYRTGDIVTLDEAGNYHLVGRKDHMIKSRGYRIELGDIEAALYSHPNVREAAVIAVPDDLITNRIKAFVVVAEPNSSTRLELDQYLSTKLPHYMVPEMMEFRGSLPKTSTGKVDRTLLVSECMEISQLIK